MTTVAAPLADSRATSLWAVITTCLCLAACSVPGAGPTPTIKYDAGHFIRDWLVLAPIPPRPGEWSPDSDWLHRTLEIYWMDLAGRG